MYLVASLVCVVASGVAAVGGWSMSTSAFNQDSGIASLDISQMLCRMQQAVIIRGT